MIPMLVQEEGIALSSISVTVHSLTKEISAKYQLVLGFDLIKAMFVLHTEYV